MNIVCVVFLLAQENVGINFVSLAYRPAKLGYWVCFRDGLQRVLFFTVDPFQCDRILQGTNMQRVNMDLTLSLESVGVSLVNDTRGLEVAFIGIFQ